MTLVDSEFMADPVRCLERAARSLALSLAPEARDPSLLPRLMGVHAKQNVPYIPVELDDRAAAAGVTWLSRFVDPTMLLAALQPAERSDSAADGYGNGVGRGGMPSSTSSSERENRAR
jgi:hypothetical protein